MSVSGFCTVCLTGGPGSSSSSEDDSKYWKKSVEKSSVTLSSVVGVGREELVLDFRPRESPGATVLRPTSELMTLISSTCRYLY